MWNFITSESGTVNRRAGLSVAWIAVALVAVTVLTALPAQAENSCVPYWQCYGAFCDSPVPGLGSCEGYAGCGGLWLRDHYWNSSAEGCFAAGYECTSDCT